MLAKNVKVGQSFTCGKEINPYLRVGLCPVIQQVMDIEDDAKTAIFALRGNSSVVVLISAIMPVTLRG